MLSDLLPTLTPDTIQTTGVGAGIGIAVSGFWSYMNKRLRQPLVDAEAMKIKAEASLTGIQSQKELADLLRLEMHEHIKLIKETARETLESLSLRVQQLESTNNTLRDEISQLKVHNRALEEHNKKLIENHDELQRKVCNLQRS